MWTSAPPTLPRRTVMRPSVSRIRRASRAAGGPTSYSRMRTSSCGTTASAPSRIWLRRLSATTSAIRGSRALRRSSCPIARSGGSIGVSMRGVYVAILAIIQGSRSPRTTRKPMTESQREALRRYLEPERLRELFNLQGSVYASRGGGFEGEIYGPFHALRESGPVHEGAPGPLVGYDGP